MSKLIHSDMDATFGNLECAWCSNEYADSGGSEEYLNAHVAINELRMMMRPTLDNMAFDEEVMKFMLGILGGQAKASVAEYTDTELFCWCGHTLHFPECVDDGTCHRSIAKHEGSCRDRYVAIGE